MTVKLMHLMLLAGAVICACAAGEATPPRPAAWAVPLALEGVPNLHRLNDTLYRSAQPTALGMQELRRLGIRTVINLRSFHSDRDEIGSTGLGYEHIAMKAWHPEREDAVEFLRLVTDPKRQPVLVHCQHGADRTGALCAIYRIVVEGWTKAEALREMREGGYGFHEFWQNLPVWIDDLNVADLRKPEAAGTGTPATRGP